MTNEKIVAALPKAREIYSRIKYNIEDLYFLNGRLTFDEVKEIAAAATVEGSALFHALVRIIECENIITLELA